MSNQRFPPTTPDEKQWGRIMGRGQEILAHDRLSQLKLLSVSWMPRGCSYAEGHRPTAEDWLEIAQATSGVCQRVSSIVRLVCVVEPTLQRGEGARAWALHAQGIVAVDAQTPEHARSELMRAFTPLADAANHVPALNCTPLSKYVGGLKGALGDAAKSLMPHKTARRRVNGPGARKISRRLSDNHADQRELQLILEGAPPRYRVLLHGIRRLKGDWVADD